MAGQRVPRFDFAGCIIYHIFSFKVTFNVIIIGIDFFMVIGIRVPTPTSRESS